MTEGTTEETRGVALARYYDLDLADDPGDLDLYAALARRTGSPLLELAAGTGRIAIPLAASGFAVTGVDIDRHMLDRARLVWSAHSAGTKRSTKGALDLVEADLLTLDLGARFGLVILAFNGMLLLGDRLTQLDALKAMARHVRDDGIAVIDVWLPSPDDLAIYDGRAIVEWIRDDPTNDARVAKVVSATYDSATTTVTLTHLFDSWPSAGGGVQRIERVDHLRLLGAEELVAMVESAGMTVETIAGDYGMTPFGPGAERAVVIARPTDTGRLV